MTKVIVGLLTLVTISILVGVAFFNYWIRMAVMGRGHLADGQWKAFLKSLVPSSFMIVVAGIVIGVAFYGLSIALFMTGFKNTFYESSFKDAVTLLTILATAFGLIMTFLSCCIFASWSPTLVEIALDQRYVNSTNPDQDATPSLWRMALILLAIVVLTQILSWLIEFVPGGIIRGSAAIVFFALSISVIGAAHGVAFRLSTGRTGPLQVAS